MTIGSHELALTIINDGAGYKDRCDRARATVESFTAVSARFNASNWLSIAKEGARAYEKEFGTPDTASSFSAIDILLAAAELAEYYAQHIKEQ